MGRPPDAYSISDEFGFVLGALVERQTTSLVILSPSGKVMEKSGFSYDTPWEVEEHEGKIINGNTDYHVNWLCKTLCSVWNAFATDHIKKAQGKDSICAPPRLLACCVAVCGPIRADHIIAAIRFNPFEGVNLEEALRTVGNGALGKINLFQMHDAAAAAYGLSRYKGLNAASKNYVVVTLTSGIGAAWMLDGALVQGRRNMEAGHISVTTNTHCSCGGIGCWETVAASDAIVNRAASRGWPLLLHLRRLGAKSSARKKRGRPRKEEPHEEGGAPYYSHSLYFRLLRWLAEDARRADGYLRRSGTSSQATTASSPQSAEPHVAELDDANDDVESVYQIALDSFEEAASWIATGVCSLVNLCAPEAVILCGQTISIAGDLLESRIDKKVRQRRFRHLDPPPILMADPLGPREWDDPNTGIVKKQHDPLR